MHPHHYLFQVVKDSVVIDFIFKIYCLVKRHLFREINRKQNMVKMYFNDIAIFNKNVFSH